MARHRRARWTTIIITVAAAVLLLAPGAPAAQRIPEAAAPREARTAPLNPAFVLWQSLRGLDPVLRAASPHGLGLVPSPVVGYAGKSPSSEGAVGAYPSSYDLRTLGKLTAVRNQGSWGTCWTFGSTGSLESSSLPGETLDLSEDNMALTSGFNVGGAATAAEKYDAGGNADMATAYFVRWGGPVLETDDAYGDSFTPAGLTAKRHVQNVDIWSGRTSATDNDRIKYAVTTYGGADISMLWSDASYNSATRSYCYTGTGHPNHDVMVVGWNDDYAASNFSPAAAGNGAFIVRNSWGGSWGSGGYFYVSYYDTRFGRQYTDSGNTYTNDVYTFEAAQPAANYGGIYQYDPLGVTGYRGYGAGVPAWGANVYTATADSMLNAVGFYALAPNTAYEVWEGPTRTSLTKLTSGTLPDMGYHTVAVPSGTALTGGASFCVAIKLTTPGWSWPLAYESPIANYTSAASAAAGQSYYGSNGTTWTDLTTSTANANVCLKAYASRIPTTASTYSFSPSATSGWKNTAQTVPLTGAAGDGATRMIYYTQDGGTNWGRTLNLSVNMNVTEDGSHSIKYYSVDSLASEPVHSPGYVNLDTVKPSTGDNHLSVTLTDPATVTLTPTDATSGVAKTEYKVDGAATYTTGTSVVLHAGAHTVAYRSTDNAGNVETDQTFSATVAATPPASSTTYASFAADATSGWKTSTQTVTVNATAGSGTGLSVSTSQDGGTTWSTTAGATATVSVSAQGAHQIRYYAKDSLSTETTHTAGWVNIDTVAPATTDNHLSVPLVNSATITLTPSDATSGVTGGLARTQYKVDGAASYSTGTSVVLSTLGAHTVVYRSTDKAGNVESPDKTFSVTVRAPLAPVSSTTFASFAPNATSGWQTAGQSVTVSASGGDGVARTIHYTQDGGVNWSTSTAVSVTVPVTTQGAHHFEYYASDSLATETVHDAGWVNIDSVAPVTADNHLTAALAAPATITLTPSDASSGVKWTQYKVDGAASYTTGASVVLSTPGSHTVAYRSVDNASNVENPDKTFTVTVTAGVPASTTAFTGFAADATSDWLTSAPQTVHITASGGSGAGRTIHYSQDGGAGWSTAVSDSADLTVTTQGAHHVEFYASDSLATESTHDAGWVNIDTVAPATSDDHALGAGLGPTTVTLTPTDATSGMTGGLARTQYKVDGAASYSTGTSVLLAEGTHTVAYRSTDKAGNVESPDKTFTCTVIGPLSPLSQSDYAFAADAVSGWKNTAQQFTVTAAGGSGTDRTIHYTLDGGTTWSTSTAASVDVPVTTEGAHHVQFYVLDSLNGEGPHDGWVNIDTRKPLTKAVKASVRKGRKVTLKYRVTDAVPGCGKAALKLQIRKRTKVVKTIALGTKGTNVALSYRYTAKLKRGAYTWRVLATDIAGNATATMRSARLVIR